MPDCDLCNIELLITAKARIKKWSREPQLIPDELISRQVALCNAADVGYGPQQMALRESIGSEYEYKLGEYAKLWNLKYKGLYSTSHDSSVE